MPDKYHGGVPTDRPRPFRARRSTRAPSIWRSLQMALVLGVLAGLRADPQVPGLTSIANTTGAFQGTVQTPPLQDQFTLQQLGQGNVFQVAPPTGVVATDQAAIATAAAAVSAAGGGTVRLQAGAYAVSSFARTTDASVTAGLTITAATNSGTTITATVSSTAGLAVGDLITVSALGAMGGTWANTIVSANVGVQYWTISNIVDSTHFKFVVNVAPTGSYTASSATVSTPLWTYTGTAPTVGQYVVGVNVLNRLPQVTSVTPPGGATGFKTDIPPNGTVSGGVVFHSPAIVLPEGVSVEGVGSLVIANGTNVNPSAVGYATEIQDSGSGATVLIRGSLYDTLDAGGYGLSNLSLVNTGTATWGLLVGNGAYYIESNKLDIYNYTVGGIGLDNNINAHDFRNTTIRTCGNASSSTYTGGLITHPYNSGSSAGCNFYNPFFIGCSGWGVVDGSGNGAFGVVLWDALFNATRASSATNSGYSAWMGGGSGNYSSEACIIGGWSESAATGDLITTGTVTIIGFHMSSPTAYAVKVLPSANSKPAYVNFIGCTSQGHTTATVTATSPASISWMGMDVGNAGSGDDPYFISGGPASPLPPFGTVVYGGGPGIFVSGQILGAGYGISPGTLTGGNASNAIYQGSGVPSNANGNNGDTYLRTDTPGTANQRIYVKSAGSWVGIV